nr:helix-turn-helix domain-containing protein [Pseudomonas luteola]
MLSAPAYHKGDLRRMLIVLAAIETLEEPSFAGVAEATGLDFKTVNDLLTKAQEQAGVVIEKTKISHRHVRYAITDWGPVIKKSGAIMAFKGELGSVETSVSRNRSLRKSNEKGA